MLHTLIACFAEAFCAHCVDALPVLLLHLSAGKDGLGFSQACAG
jgi:hypothetical protein